MRVNWPENIADILGTMSDAKIAKQVGTTRQTVFRLRQRMGIPCRVRVSLAQALMELVTAVEAAPWPKGKSLASAIDTARESLKGVRIGNEQQLEGEPQQAGGSSSLA